MAVKGACGCGKVAYEIDGELYDATSCHCSTCRKSSGSSSTAFALFPQGKFSWISGEEKLTHYQSSEDMGNLFCSVCGSSVAGTYKGEIGWVTLGSVDDNTSIKVEKHIFMGSKAPWETTPEQVLQYVEFPE
ncbi:MAG: GFA family protein [Candidatus Thiodiazotropha sp. (ex. Lucinisca nassula)]|nr:GFA family protein [Candidatus Thiodiazotropha sp. (ex. Lucinisca nassula)]